MEITEAGLYAALGVTPPANGAQGQEVADPAKPTGAQDQELADPEMMDAPEDIENPDTETEAGSAHDNADETGKDGKPPLTKEQRRENAARRRQAEQQAAIDNALAEERAKRDTELAGILKNMGLKDPDTGDPIESVAQLKAFQKKQADAAMQKRLREGKLTERDIARVVADQMEQSQQQTQRQQEQAAARQRINDELAQIMEMDKSITCVGDLLTMPGAEEFKKKVDKGYSFLDAFTLVRGPELQKAKAEAIKQSALNNARGKEHLHATGGGRGTGAVTVPKDVLAMYRVFNPGATDAQIQAHYNKNKRK